MLFTRLSLLASRRFSPGPLSPSTITPSVSVSRTSGVGPLGISFDATGTTSTETTMPFQDILVLWTFGDDDAPTWAYGARPGILKKNHATGGIASHVYETPGTYTWTATFYDGVSLVTTSGSVTVSDPATVYAGAATICVSSSGLPVAGVNGVPAGAQCFQLATIELATAKITGANQRLLLCRGDSFTVSGTNNVPAFSGLTIGAYGTGAKPLVTFIGSTTNYGAFTPRAADYRIMDIQATTAFTGTYITRFMSSSQDHVLMLRIDGLYISSLVETGIEGDYNIVAECTLHQPCGGSGNVGIWQEWTVGGAILGCSITECLSVRGYIEHNVRTQRANKFVVSCTTMTNPATSKWLHAYRGDQRDYPGGNPGWAEYAIFSDNLYDQGTSNSPRALQIQPQSDGRNERIRHVIAERNVFYHTSVGASSGFIKLTAEYGLRVRNNLIYEQGGGGFVMWYDDGDEYVLAQGTDFAIENNSIVGTSTAGVSFIRLATRKAVPWVGGKVYNNLMYAPNSTGDGSSSLAYPTMISVQSGLTDPTNYSASNNSTNTQVKSVSPLWSVTPPVTLSDWGLQGSSYAKDSGVQVPVLEDFFGTARAGTMDMGAVVG